MAWRTARSLLVLHAQLKAGSRAAPPATEPNAWGTIGDAVHDPTSDHSPHNFPGWGSQIVTAADFPNRPDFGLDAHQVLDDIRRSRDGRVKYGISNGQMFSSYASSGYGAWTWRPYNPRNGDRHFTHGHLSVQGDARSDGSQPWATIGRAAAAPAAPTPTSTEDPMYLANVQGTDPVYLTNGLTARWVSAEEFAHLVALHNEGTQPLTYGGKIRTVAFQSMIGDVTGPRPPVLGPDEEIDAILTAIERIHVDMDDADRDAIINALLTAPNNRLIEADRPLLVDAFKQAAREGTGA